MITRKTLATTLKSYQRMREDNPALTGEECSAILVAASNESVAQAIYSMSDLNLTIRSDNQALLNEEATTAALKDFFKGQ